jgi:hypothetical protein
MSIEEDWTEEEKILFKRREIDPQIPLIMMEQCVTEDVAREILRKRNEPQQTQPTLKNPIPMPLPPSQEFIIGKSLISMVENLELKGEILAEEEEELSRIKEQIKNTTIYNNSQLNEQNKKLRIIVKQERALDLKMRTLEFEKSALDQRIADLNLKTAEFDMKIAENKKKRSGYVREINEVSEKEFEEE